MNGTERLQSKQLVVGLLYSFSILTPSLASAQTLEHRFAVSRDRNQRYHLFRHTLSSPNSACSDGSCGGEGQVGGDAASSPMSLRVGNSSAQLNVASYNIWNVNGVKDEGEEYEERLKRFGKVCLEILCSSPPPRNGLLHVITLHPYNSSMPT